MLEEGRKQNTCFVLRPISSFGEDRRSYFQGHFLCFVSLMAKK